MERYYLIRCIDSGDATYWISGDDWSYRSSEGFAFKKRANAERKCADLWKSLSFKEVSELTYSVLEVNGARARKVCEIAKPRHIYSA
jgi:hypothetical protein